MTLEPGERDALIVRSLQGTATPADERRLAALLESVGFRRHYEATRRLWTLTEGEHARIAAALPVPHEVDRQITLRRLTGEHAAVSPPRTLRWVAAAAVACLLVGGGLLTRLNRESSSFESTSAAEYRTRATETMTVTLADGSVARLAPRSRLRVLRSRHRRALHLEGHAFFAVHRDSRRPFILHTASGDLEATGGRFDVQATATATEVLVVDGEITMAAGGGRVGSASGHAVRATESTVVADTVTDFGPRLAWMRGFLVFRDTPLITAAHEVEQLYGVKVEVPEVVADRTVTAWFDEQRLLDVLDVITRATSTTYTLQDGVARLEEGSPGGTERRRTAVGS
jgi:ferric-dicitrate binding protein FerR (iron transport regulator)